MLALDLLLLGLIAGLCWQGYQRRRLWFVVPVFLWMGLGKGYGFWRQFLVFGLPVVGWLLLCHWINTHGWHATAAGGILMAMSVGLQAMRMFEDEQQWNREQSEVEQ